MRNFQIGIICILLIISKTLSGILDSDESSEESDESNESNESEGLPDMRFCHDDKGVCTSLKNCKKLLNKWRIPFDIAEIKSSKKYCQPEVTNDVCCSTNSTVDDDRSTLRTSSINQFVLPTKSCGLVHKKRYYQKVVGGKNSEIGAWPWLAVFAYDLVTNIAFKCGGSLVTNRHVITAAHCIVFNLYFIRLGEFDFNSDVETKHLDVNFTKVIKADFDTKTGHNDLAIIVLSESVQFTDLISPICLPTAPNLREKSYVGTKPFVAGWGYTLENGKSAKILQELQITVLDNQLCHDKFKAAGLLTTQDQFDKTVICAGELEGGKDTCQGDSGGPLMKPETSDGPMRFYLIGVVSRGHGCARKNLAASYTSIPYHLEWIMKHMII